jgi:hypothetical protein
VNREGFSCPLRQRAFQIVMRGDAAAHSRLLPLALLELLLFRWGVFTAMLPVAVLT